MKINITHDDYTCNGLGYNDFNFICNVTPRISSWLLSEFEYSRKALVDDKRKKDFANKLIQIATIIDGDIDE